MFWFLLSPVSLTANNTAIRPSRFGRLGAEISTVFVVGTEMRVVADERERREGPIGRREEEHGTRRGRAFVRVNVCVAYGLAHVQPDETYTPSGRVQRR